MEACVGWFSRVCIRVLATAIVVLACTAGISSFVTADSEPVLDVLDEEGVFEPDGEDSGELSMIITMQGRGENGLEDQYSFETHLLDEKNTPQPPWEGTLNRYGAVSGSNLTQFKATVSITDISSTGVLSGTLTGYLIVKDGDGAVESEALPLTVKPKVQPMKAFGLVMVGFTDVLLFGLASALFWLIACFLVLCLKYDGDWREILGGDIGAITWKFSENWVANFTGATGIAVVILGLKFTMEATKLSIGVEEYALLGAIFALASTAFAGAIGAITTSFLPKTGRPNATRVWIYLLVVSIIIWGSVGALATAALFMDEARLGLHLDNTTVLVLQALILVLGVVAFVYSIRKTSDAVVEMLTPRIQQKALSALGDAIASALEQLNKGEDLKTVVNRFRNDDLLKRWAWALEALKGSSPQYSVGTARDLLLHKLDRCASEDTPLRARILLATALGNVTDVSEALEKLLGTPEDVALAASLQQAVTSLYQGVEREELEALKTGDLAASLWQALTPLYQSIEQEERETLDPEDAKRAEEGMSRLAQDASARWEESRAVTGAGPTPPIYLP